MDNQAEGSGPSELELLKQRARLLGVEFSNNIGIDTLRERVNAKIGEVNGDATGSGDSTGESQSAEQNQNDQQDTPTEGAQQDPNFDDDIEEEEVVEQPATPAAPAAPVNGFEAAAQIASAKVTAPATAPIQGKAEIKPITPIVDTTADLSAPGKANASPLAPRVGRTPTLRQHLYNEQMKLVRLRIQNLDPKKADLNGEIITVANKHLGNVKIFVPYGEVTDDGWHVPYIIYKELARRKFLSIRTVKDPRTKQPVVKKGWAKEFALDILPPLTQAEINSLAVAQAAAGSIDSGNSDLM